MARTRWPAVVLAAAVLLVVGGALPGRNGWMGRGQPSLSTAVTVSEQEHGDEPASDRPGLAILLRKGSEPSVTVVASQFVSDALGSACVHEALEPFMVREASAGGEPDYLAKLATETLDAAEEAGRFGDGRPDRPLALGLAFALLSLAALAWWLAGNDPARDFVAAEGLAEKRRLLERRLAEANASVEEARARQGDTLALLERTVPGKWDSVPLVAALRRRRRRAKVEAVRKASDASISALEDAMGKEAELLAGVERRVSNRRDTFVRRVDLLRSTRDGLLRVVQPASVVALVLAGSYAVLAANGHLPSFGADVVSFSDDSLLGMAVGSSGGLAERFRSRCGIDFVTVTDGPSAQTDVDRTLPPPAAELPVDAAAFASIAAARSSLGRHPAGACSIGNPCGGSCIPAGRVCHVGQPVSRARACGRSYIAANETCHIGEALGGVATETQRPSDGASSALDAYHPETDTGVRASGRSVMSHTADPPRNAQSSVKAPPVGEGSVSVRGYTRSDGTAVAPYVRSPPASKSRER